MKLEMETHRSWLILIHNFIGDRIVKDSCRRGYRHRIMRAIHTSISNTALSIFRRRGGLPRMECICASRYNSVDEIVHLIIERKHSFPPASSLQMGL
jgi:hypothetical protein